ncbi:MAG: response regulator [Anaerolineales bacterium]|nr:MAG: response regulator [Anaerolineales bacterium]
MAKVLLAEDDHTMVMLLQTLLKMEGFEVFVADIDADIPAVIRQENPDALFMDVHLGQQSGMEVAESLRKDPQFSELRIVMTSGLNVREECLRRGANDFLLKPFMPDDLLALLRDNKT